MPRHAFLMRVTTAGIIFLRGTPRICQIIQPFYIRIFTSLFPRDSKHQKLLETFWLTQTRKCSNHPQPPLPCHSNCNGNGNDKRVKLESLDPRSRYNASVIRIRKGKDVLSQMGSWRWWDSIVLCSERKSISGCRDLIEAYDLDTCRTVKISLPVFLPTKRR